jgi:uncharacterized membrane protein
METAHEERIARLEREVTRLGLELERLRPHTHEPKPKPAPTPPSPVVRAPAPPAPRRVPVVPPRLAAARRSFDPADLLGARALAWVGGAVTLLGVAFFYVLAVNHGWIGPEVRIALGGIASSLAFGAGLWLRRRFGVTYAALAAVGAGIAGYYATLLAATELYNLLPDPVALVVAGAVAAVGVALSLLWSEQILAGLGLVGAIAVPALLVPDSGLTSTGTSFAVIVLAAAAVVAVVRRWLPLLVVAAVGAGAQVAALVLTADGADGRVVAVAGVFCLVLLAAGIAWQLRAGATLDAAATGFALASAGFAFLSAWVLYRKEAQDPRAEGIALLVAAAVYGVPALLLRRRSGDFASVLGALALAVGAVAIADLFSGATLTYAWAAEAVVLAWLAFRQAPRFQLPAVAYLALALGHTLAIDAQPKELFVASAHPASGVPSLLAVLAAALAVGLLTPRFGRAAAGAIDRRLAAGLEAVQPSLRVAALAVASLLVLDSVALLVLWAFGADGFDRAQIVITGLWSLAGLAAVVVGARRSPVVTTFGLAWLALVLFKAVGYDWHTAGPHLASWSFLFCGAALLLAGFLLRALSESEEGLVAVPVLTSPTAAVLGLVASAVLLGFDVEAGPNRHFGLGVLALAAIYAGLGASVFSRPRLTTLSRLHWGIAVPLLCAAEALLIHNEGWTFVAWAGTAAALAWLSRATRERGFQLAAVLVLTTALLGALARFTRPDHLWQAGAHPAGGLWVLLACIAATVVVAVCETRYRAVVASIGALLAVFAVSLGILELAERVSGGSVATDFQRGHTAVSAFWVLLGLGLLYAGLRRHSQPLRLAGFALFGVSLGKIFLYDLSTLSSVTRALSFLAVGGVLLTAGFFYQRLTAEEPAT